MQHAWHLPCLSLLLLGSTRAGKGIVGCGPNCPGSSVCKPAVSCGLAGPVQEVLGALHGHLGSGQAPEVTAALAVLLSLAHTHGQELLQHVGFISNVLDCLPSFTQAQTHQVHCGSTLVQLSCMAGQHPNIHLLVAG